MRLTRVIYITILVSLAVLFAGCDAIDPQSGDLVDYSCEGCHTNKGTLSDIVNALDLDPPDEGHEAPG